MDNKNVFQVEKILRKRKRKGRFEYLVKWKHYGKRHNTWEPKKNILDDSLLESFEQQLKTAKPEQSDEAQPSVRQTKDEMITDEQMREDCSSTPSVSAEAGGGDAANNENWQPSADAQTDAETLPQLQPMVSESEAWMIQERKRTTHDELADYKRRHQVIITDVRVRGLSILVKESCTPQGFFVD